MHLPTNVSKKMWPMLAGSLIFFLLLGAAGWKKTLEDASGYATLSEIAENTLEMVSGHDVIVVDHQFEENWMLLVGKWGTKAMLAAALLKSGLMVFRRQIRQWRFRRVRGHQVFAGLGGYNTELAMRAIMHGMRVAVVDAREDHPRRVDLERAGALFIFGSPLVSDNLMAAGAHRAARVVVASPDGDDETVGIAEAVAALPDLVFGLGEKRDLLVCTESHEIREVLGQRWSLIVRPNAWQIRLVSFRAVALRQLVTRLAHYLIGIDAVRQCGPRILVVGDADFIDEFLRAAIPFLQISGHALSEYFVVGLGDGSTFELVHPSVPLVAKVHFIDSSEQTIAVSPELVGQKFDVAVVCLANELQTLASSQQLLRAYGYRVDRVHALNQHPSRLRLDPDPRLEIGSIFEMGLKSPEFGDLDLEQAARSNHEAYLTGLNPEELTKAPTWNDLGESFKESNRCAVLHRNIKRALWQQCSEKDQADLIETLAICEHQRWMAEKAVSGWRFGVSRDNEMRIHPDLLPFDQLSEAIKEKDRVQVRKALS